MVHLNRGIALACQDRYEEAVGDFDRAIAIDPEDTESYYQRGMARIELGRYRQAVEDLDLAARMDPGIPSPNPTVKPPPSWPGQRRRIILAPEVFGRTGHRRRPGTRPALDRTATPRLRLPPE